MRACQPWPGLVLCGLLLPSAPAAAQVISPRIMVVFDTSSSMAWRLDRHAPAGGDGSADFPLPAGVTCRLHEAKEALREMIHGLGQEEAVFGLARYHQEQGLHVNPDPAEYPLPIHYRGTCDGGDILVPFSDRSFAQLRSWIDQTEDFPTDPELRADGPSPVAATLEAVLAYFRDEVLPDDLLRDCRQHAVILFTDGQDTCDGVPSAVIGNLRAIRLADGRGPYQVNVYVIGFGRLGEEGEQTLNALAIAAGTAVGGRAYRADDRLALQVALGEIIGRALPHELCDGQDNDCDGEIDEGVRNACGECGPTPREECDGVDNDCDGETDEGVRNACGECGPTPAEIQNGLDDDCDGVVDEGFLCTWSPEVCDGVDNDCDNLIDNEVTRPCGPELGACKPGIERCHAGQWEGRCEGGIGPRPEDCNNVDDDCDGVVDQQLRDCGSDVGQCRPGVQRCVAGEWEKACVGSIPPEPEICDGLDQDCDGETDEGVTNLCGGCGEVAAEVCDGLDQDCNRLVDDEAACPEATTCVLGQCRSACFFGRCPAGQVCVAGACVYDGCALLQCPPGHHCDPASLTCVDPCAGVACAPTPTGEPQVCRLGRCGAPSCYEEGCPAGQVCRQGQCADDPCPPDRCPPDQVCRDGQCFPSCAGVACLRGQECYDGECRALPCAGVSCGPGQTCLAGRCGQDPCLGVICRAGTECSVATWVEASRCVQPSRWCTSELPPPDGSAADAGPAVADGGAAPEPLPPSGECLATPCSCVDPICRFVRCPTGQICRDGTCEAPRAEPTELDGGVDGGGAVEDGGRDATAPDLGAPRPDLGSLPGQPDEPTGCSCQVPPSRSVQGGQEGHGWLDPRWLNGLLGLGWLLCWRGRRAA